MEIDEFIKSYNIRTTNVKKNLNSDINYLDSISLLEIPKNFNIYLNMFLDKLNNLENLIFDNEKFIITDYKFTNEINTIYFKNYIINDNNNEPFFNKELIFFNYNGTYFFQLNYHFNNEIIDLTNYISIDNELIEQYFHIIMKYKNLVDAGIQLKKGIHFNNGIDKIEARIKGTLFDDIKEFDLLFETKNVLGIKLNYALGNDFHLIENKTNVFLNNIEPLNNGKIKKLTKNMRIHEKYLPDLYIKYER